MDIPEHLLDSKLIFHFTDASTAMEHVLHSGKIRFSPMDEMNDPYEYKILSSGILGSIKAEKSRALTTKLRETVLKRSKLACFVSTKVIPKDPFRYPFTKPRSWAQYGDAQKGVCLVFRKEALLQNIFKNLSEVEVYGDYVEYDLGNGNKSSKSIVSYDKNITIEDNVYRHIDANKKDVYFRKYNDFSDESEYRVVVQDRAKTQRQYLFCPIDGALESIVLGDRFGEVYQDLMVKLGQKYSSNVFKLVYGRIPYMSELTRNPDQS